MGVRPGGSPSAEHAGDLHHLEDLLSRGAVPERILDVQLEPLLVQVRGRGVDREVNELLDLVVQVILAPGRAAVISSRHGCMPKDYFTDAAMTIHDV
jgi:hypothetical protein